MRISVLPDGNGGRKTGKKWRKNRFRSLSADLYLGILLRNLKIRERGTFIMTFIIMKNFPITMKMYVRNLSLSRF